MNPSLNLAFLKDSFTLEVYASDPKEFGSKGHIYKAAQSVLRLVWNHTVALLHKILEPQNAKGLEWTLEIM